MVVPHLCFRASLRPLFVAWHVFLCWIVITELNLNVILPCRGDLEWRICKCCRLEHAMCCLPSLSLSLIFKAIGLDHLQHCTWSAWLQADSMEHSCVNCWGTVRASQRIQACWAISHLLSLAVFLIGANNPKSCQSSDSCKRLVFVYPYLWPMPWHAMMEIELTFNLLPFWLRKRSDLAIGMFVL